MEEEFLLCPVEKAQKYYKELGYIVELVDNNFNVQIGTNLVTNIKIENHTCKIYFSKFILDKSLLEKQVDDKNEQ